MRGDNVRNPVLAVIQLVKDVEYLSSGIAEDCVTPLFDQDLDDDSRSVKFHVYLRLVN